MSSLIQSRRRPSFISESLEERRLFSGLAVAAGVTIAPDDPNLFLTTSAFPDSVPAMASANAAQNADNGTAGENLQITGDIVVGFYGGSTVADLPLSHQTGGTYPSSYGDETPITLTHADSGTIVPSGQDKGYHILYYYYTGNSDFAATPQFGDTDFQSVITTGAESSGAAYYLVKFASDATASRLSFQQQPLDASVGDVLKPPVSVQVLDNDGKPDTSAKDLITLSLAGGPGTLGGTTTAFAVHGVAKFKNLSVSEAGAYTLTATSSGSNGATSSTFDITPGKLVFKTQPHTSNIGEAIKPAVRVALETSKGKLLTDADGTTVTLATIGATGGASLTGNTALIENGVATFSNLVFNDAGFFTLQATDTAGDALANSVKFKVAGDKLVFKGLAKKAVIGQALSYQVLVEDSKKKVVADITDTIDVTSADVSVPVVASATATAGVATFTTTFADTVAVGTYVLTATDASADTGNVTDATATIKLVSAKLTP